MLNDRSPWGHPPAPKPISTYAAWILSALNVCFKIMSMPFLNRMNHAPKRRDAQEEILGVAVNSRFRLGMTNQAGVCRASLPGPVGGSGPAALFFRVLRGTADL